MVELIIEAILENEGNNILWMRKVGKITKGDNIQLS